MVRPPLTDDERARGAALGTALREARGDRHPAQVALAAGISVETLRKIESGRIPTPAFFTVVALARVLDLDLVRLAEAGMSQLEPAERNKVKAALMEALAAVETPAEKPA